MSYFLQLCATNNPQDAGSPTSRLSFEREDGKKAAFFVDAKGLEIEKPAHLVIQCSGKFVGDQQEKVISFVLGGLELISNSRNVEVYTSDEDGKETYMKTCRGVVVEDIEQEKDEEWYKTVIVCNGGPQTTSRCHLKLLSLRPAKSNLAKLRTIKLKGRIPEGSDDEEKAFPANTDGISLTDTAQSSPLVAAGGIKQPPHQNQQPLGLSQEDVGSAMAAVSMMVRTTEDRLGQKFQSGIKNIETLVGQGFLGVNQSIATLGSMVISQRQQLEQHEALLTEQKQTIAAQNELLAKMEENQLVLINAVKALQDRLDETSAGVRTQEQGSESTCSNGVENGHVSESGKELSPSTSATTEVVTNSTRIVDVVGSLPCTDDVEDKVCESPITSNAVQYYMFYEDGNETTEYDCEECATCSLYDAERTEEAECETDIRDTEEEKSSVGSPSCDEVESHVSNDNNRGESDETARTNASTNIAKPKEINERVGMESTDSNECLEQRQAR